MNIGRKDILKLLKDNDFSPATLKGITQKFQVNDKAEKRKLKAILVEMIEEGVILKDGRGRYLVPGKNMAVGTIGFTRKGLGAFVARNDIEKIYVSSEEASYAIDGDTVLVEIYGRYRDLPRGKVTKVIKRNREFIVGTFKTRGIFAFVVADDPKIKYDFYVSPEEFNGARPDEKVVVKILKYPSPGRNPEGKVHKILGSTDDPAVDLPTVILKHMLPEPGWFPEDVVREAKKVAKRVTKTEISRRKDFRNENIFTIDGEDAKDFDDAVGIKKLENGNFNLSIHIADVSHYVKKDSKLDREATSRGTSVYLMNTVIPMLPFELSNEMCSLKQGVNRLTVSVEMEIDRHGKVINHEVSNGVINSFRRLTYSEVNRFLDGEKDKDLMKKLSPVGDELKMAMELAMAIRDNRKKRGSVMEISSREARIITDDEGHVVDIVPGKRGQSEVMIEEFMIAANETVAEIFSRLELPFVYRIHEEPDLEAVMQLKNYLEVLGLKVKVPHNIHPKVLQQILVKSKNHPLFSSIERLVVRTMKRAVYSENNVGHFGLASTAYTHFTSPIRRYPDLIVHRLLKTLVVNGRLSDEEIKIYEESLPRIASHCSKRERVANEAEWDLLDMKKVEYVSYHVGEKFKVVVTGVTKFGLFVEITDKMVSGLIHISTLDDYYIFDENQNILIGKSTRKVYRIGDELEVQAIRADKATMEVDFEIATDEDEKDKKSFKKRRRGKRNSKSSRRTSSKKDSTVKNTTSTRSRKKKKKTGPKISKGE